MVTELPDRDELFCTLRSQLNTITQKSRRRQTVEPVKSILDKKIRVKLKIFL